MPKPKPTRLEFTSRRLLRAWVSEHLNGELTIVDVSPTPHVWDRATSEPLPRRKPRVARVTVQVRERNAPAGKRTVVRQYAFRVPTPTQWLRHETNPRFGSHYWLRNRRGAVWDRVGLDLGDFWFSAPRLVVEERAPIIEAARARWDKNVYELVIPDVDAFPGVDFWLELAARAGFRMVPIDSRGFILAVDDVRWGNIDLAERVPRNLSRPLSCEIRCSVRGEVTTRARSFEEADRATTLRTALEAAVRALPGIAVHSGNCVFSLEEWDRLTNQTPPVAPPEVKVERSVVVSIDRARR